jgi:hypothetical protein
MPLWTPNPPLMDMTLDEVKAEAERLAGNGVRLDLPAVANLLGLDSTGVVGLIELVSTIMSDLGERYGNGMDTQVAVGALWLALLEGRRQTKLSKLVSAADRLEKSSYVLMRLAMHEDTAVNDVDPDPE